MDKHRTQEDDNRGGSGRGGGQKLSLNKKSQERTSGRKKGFLSWYNSDVKGDQICGGSGAARALALD